jgi:2,3-bisphosphoglycerate-dependent phosphoglycerate mutase
MQLYLIRHAQSTNNVSWDQKDTNGYIRSSDPHLTDLGVKQAQTLGSFIASQPFSVQPNVGEYRHRVHITHLYSSLMTRAIQTGTILSDALGIPLYGLPEVHEIGGIYLETEENGNSSISIEHGVTPAYLREHFPALRLHQPIEERGWWQGGMEPIDSPLIRAHAVLDLLRERHLPSNDRVAIVTHGGFFNSLIRLIFNIRTDEPDNRNLPTWFSLCNCAISRIDFVDDRAIWVYHNRTTFMDDDLVTC